jgi:hypothetical protein
MSVQENFKVPDFFETIRQKSIHRWAQLDQDPELAGPWHQLFKQVKSPCHVLSELLQNADDAGAREASVWIDDNVFCFEHDGEDFTEEHFASICRFGYSNKRLLHTIGFRGIGFKSTFSLGDRVDICTPTLSVYFDSNHFTEPCWSSRETCSDGKTRIFVVIQDEHRKKELEKNFEEWKQSPLSLLFFKNIRTMRVDRTKINWRSVGPGPVPNSEWMALGDAQDPFLLVRSEGEPFPEEAIEEIKKERNIEIENSIDFPPATLEIVLGARGELFLVLPTGVKTALPFACNAPFIQDPARLKIKEPATSPTNRWLLQRAGQLAANSMLGWLNQTDAPHEERARAYNLLPNANDQNNLLESTFERIVMDAFKKSIHHKPFLLTDDGLFVKAGQAVALPDPILDVWSPQQAVHFFGEHGLFPLLRSISLINRKKLLDFGWIQEVDKNKIINILQERSLPRPENWEKLCTLWNYLKNDILSWTHPPMHEKIKIIPVESDGYLHTTTDVVRLGDKKWIESEHDYKFITKHILIYNREWCEFIEKENNINLDTIKNISKKMDLERNTNLDVLIDRVAKGLLQEKRMVGEWVQLAHLSAKFNISIQKNFRYVTRDNKLHSSEDVVLYDSYGDLEEIIPENKRDLFFIHLEYSRNFVSCTEKEWKDWVIKDKSGIQPFILLNEIKKYIYNENNVKIELCNRGYINNMILPYGTRNEFQLQDWDFDQGYWLHWENLAKTNKNIWHDIIQKIATKIYLNKSKKSSIHQIAKNRWMKLVHDGYLLSSWIVRFQKLACLKDTKGFCRKPDELLRRTPKTEPLLGFEDFVCPEFDKEANHELLDLLGVHSAPLGPDQILKRLRVLAKSEQPPMPTIERMYESLDQMLQTCSTQDAEKIKISFRSDRLIRSDKNTWENASSVFRLADEEDVPGATLVHKSVQNLALWQKVGVVERPTVELAIQWLQGLPVEKKISPSDFSRVRKLLKRHPHRVWNECGRWLNLAGEWTKTSALSYALTNLFSEENLHEWVKQKTADFGFLSTEEFDKTPFIDFPRIDSCIEKRFQHNALALGEPEEKIWLTTFAAELRRIELDDPAKTDHVRALALRLAKTRWLAVEEIEVIPYLDGKPVGLPQRPEILWQNEVLFTRKLKQSKLAKMVPEEIGKYFHDEQIKDALVYSFERVSDEIKDYLNDNFYLVPLPTESPLEVLEVMPVSDAIVSEDDENETVLSNAPIAMPAALPTSPLSSPEAEEASKNIDHSSSTPPSAPLVSTRKQHHHVQPSMMERFALSQGFHKNVEGGFFHADGSRITKTSDEIYPWERRMTSGVVRYYYPIEHCFENKALSLGADVWGMLEKFQNQYSIVVYDGKDHPIEMTGVDLQTLVKEGKLKLYPAAYRLVLTR